jgi:hypothetical protein
MQATARRADLVLRWPGKRGLLGLAYDRHGSAAGRGSAPAVAGCARPSAEPVCPLAVIPWMGREDIIGEENRRAQVCRHPRRPARRWCRRRSNGRAGARRDPFGATRSLPAPPPFITVGPLAPTSTCPTMPVAATHTSAVALLRPCTLARGFGPPPSPPRRARERVAANRVDRLSNHRFLTRAAHPRAIPTTTAA